MENAVEALKIAFAVMMFCGALTLSISSFSSARSAASEIINMRDRETEYTYVEPTENLTRTVGVETIVPSMYRAYRENIEIYFFDANGNPLTLYYKTDKITGKREQDINGHDIEVNYVNLTLENFGSAQDAIEHLDILMASSNGDNEKIRRTEGLYAFLSKYAFEEKLGEYYQGTGTSKIKKRVITYTIQHQL